MASCSFRPNFWRPTTCTNCLRPKSCHKIGGDDKTGECLASDRKYNSGNKVGAVSPYAVVEVKVKPAVTCSAVNYHQGKPRRRGDSASCQTNGLPRRKAPPPPSHIDCSNTSERHTDDVNSSGVVQKKKAGPKKPPRTVSTYLEDLAMLVPGCEKSLDYSVLSDGSCKTRGSWVSGHLASLLTDTLHCIYAKFLEKVICPDPLWKVRWQNLSLLSPSTVVCKGVQLGLQRLNQQLDPESENDIRISRYLSPHPNLNLVRALLPPPPSLPQLCCSSRYLLRDGCAIGTLAELLPTCRTSLAPQQLQQLLLLCMVQVFSAVNFIYNFGVCHRAIALDCLYVTQYGDHWIVRLGNFHYALHRPGPVNTTSFVYSFEELRWLGGPGSRLPPEIMNVPDNEQTLNYSGTDCFAIGCLFYEFLAVDNPFEVNSQLVYAQYKAADLKPLPFTSPATQKLMQLLLCRDPRNRLTPCGALLLCQSLLWLPSYCLDSQVPEMLLGEFLDYESANLVALLATMDIRPLPLSYVLHANFLHSCNVTDLYRTLCIFHGL